MSFSTISDRSKLSMPNDPIDTLFTIPTENPDRNYFAVGASISAIFQTGRGRLLGFRDHPRSAQTSPTTTSPPEFGFSSDPRRADLLESLPDLVSAAGTAGRGETERPVHRGDVGLPPALVMVLKEPVPAISSALTSDCTLMRRLRLSWARLRRPRRITPARTCLGRCPRCERCLRTAPVGTHFPGSA